MDARSFSAPPSHSCRPGNPRKQRGPSWRPEVRARTWEKRRDLELFVHLLLFPAAAPSSTHPFLDAPRRPQNCRSHRRGQLAWMLVCFLRPSQPLVPTRQPPQTARPELAARGACAHMGEEAKYRADVSRRANSAGAILEMARFGVALDTYERHHRTVFGDTTTVTNVTLLVIVVLLAWPLRLS